MGEPGTRPTAVFYRPQARLLIMEFPRRGAYIYHGVTARTYDVLKASARARFRFGQDAGHHYSIVETL